MRRNLSRQRRFATGGLFVLAGVIAAVAGSLIPGIILIVAGLIILGLGARGYETGSDPARGRSAYGPNGSNIKNQ